MKLRRILFIIVIFSLIFAWLELFNVPKTPDGKITLTSGATFLKTKNCKARCKNPKPLIINCKDHEKFCEDLYSLDLYEKRHLWLNSDRTLASCSTYSAKGKIGKRDVTIEVDCNGGGELPAKFAQLVNDEFPEWAFKARLDKAF